MKKDWITFVFCGPDNLCSSTYEARAPVHGFVEVQGKPMRGRGSSASLLMRFV
ncbi:hypothetical protein BDZ94DRAFT_1275492 [Collybia nuda]|uniref:Uncharacterized protein n=1 Tax=Collybia nuda TaxID=64659 RepID=A0A9P6CBW7_9AGAR|nr:hypothetical protein BDZ94DRAFT_1275492 [Collybia nuda]